ncbi:secretory pathway Sec39 [Ascodesmis nigricans]|uniref:Secretory pathway Sec39 n=1 Tax=Ascodesmis nigricans TaxID=341454 RepID=A0A4S2N2R2_9PEZI|nr:secretory pathway Sec39 [Ascodesmis nigricans]
MPQPLPTTAACLSQSKTILLAVYLASSGTPELHHLRSFVQQHPSILSEKTLLQILLTLPESTPPSSYKDFIDHVLSGAPLVLDSSDADSTKVDLKPVEKLSDSHARRALQQYLPSLHTKSPLAASSPELLVTSFLIARACRIESELGALDIITELLTSYNHLNGIQGFLNAKVHVLSKLVYEYSQELRPAPSLTDFDNMDVEEALEVLISDPTTVTRDLTTLVEPYLRLHNDEKWAHVWTRLSALPFPNAAEVAQNWTPPESVRLQFMSWAISVCYRCSETNQRSWDAMHQIHRRICALVDGQEMEGKTPGMLGDVADLKNPLIQPTRAVLQLLALGITSSSILSRSLAETMRLRLEGSMEVQIAVLRQLVRSGVNWENRNDNEWKRLRNDANWLRTKSEVIGRVPREEVENILLAGMLAGTRFNLAKSIYVLDGEPPLPMEAVEKCVLDAFSEFFDNASNGNRTRGHMKNAYQCIQILYPQASHSPALERAYRLINAVHALSSYSLTLTPGVPLLPVQIRIHPDPISLFPKLLDSNSRSYLQPDALISIAQDLLTATSKDVTTISPSNTEARVLGMTTEAALNTDDFETAYAFITTRLLPMASAHPDADTAPTSPRNVLWKTAFLAGRFRSAVATLSSAPPRGQMTLKALEKKLELLAIAIRFCQGDALPDVLEQWRRCEEEAESVIEAEQRAEAEHLKLAERAGITAGISGVERHKEGVGRGGWAGAGVDAYSAGKADSRRRGSLMDDGEAPQSLFEVARGAASLLGGEGKKREAVKGAVTKGLASGLGWVLGAQPVKQ